MTHPRSTIRGSHCAFLQAQARRKSAVFACRNKVPVTQPAEDMIHQQNQTCIFGLFLARP
jgi:hypothetical protein